MLNSKTNLNRKPSPATGTTTPRSNTKPFGIFSAFRIEAMQQISVLFEGLISCQTNLTTGLVNTLWDHQAPIPIFNQHCQFVMYTYSSKIHLVAFWMFSLKCANFVLRSCICYFLPFLVFNFLTEGYLMNGGAIKLQNILQTFYMCIAVRFLLKWSK